MNQLYFKKKKKKNYEIIAFMAKEICDCLLHFAGRKSGFRDAGKLCWDPQATQLHLEWQLSLPSSGALSLWGTIWCTSSVSLLIFWKQNTPSASENNSSEVSSAVPHPTLLTTCKQLASVFLIKKGWLTPSITIPTKLDSTHTHTHTHTHTEVEMACREIFRRNLENGYGVNKESFSRYWSSFVCWWEQFARKEEDDAVEWRRYDQGAKIVRTDGGRALPVSEQNSDVFSSSGFLKAARREGRRRCCTPPRVS